MSYIRGKGTLVGVFYFSEMEKGEDLKAIARAKEETGLEHEYREAWCENCVPVGQKIWLAATCDKRD